jgi:tetratricopeptide (TPR) repeat protein
MEKKSLLGSCHRALAIAFLVVGVSSCSLPRIAILHDPLATEEHVNLGVSYERRGEFDAALAEYKVAAKKLPIANLYMGNIYFAEKKFDLAEKFYKRAIAKADSPDACNNLAWLYFTTGTNLVEAEKLAEKAVELSPQSEEFRDTLAKIRVKRGQRDR